MSTIKILFLAANPIKRNILSLDEEVRAIDESILMAEHGRSLQLISAWAVHPEDLLRLLNRHRPHIVHFSGHGSPEGEIILVEDRQQTPVSAATLQKLFSVLKDNIRLVVLNSCFSAIRAKGMTKAIDCVIGMNAAVGDNAAIVFAAALYGAIGSGRSVQGAFDQGLLAVSLRNLSGERTPKLLHRPGVNPARITLVSERSSAKPIKGRHTAQARKPTARSSSAKKRNDLAGVDESETHTTIFASTFLSHSSSDKPLVEAVARELGRRGVLAWLDKNELQTGSSLTGAITTAIREHATVTAFLSTESVKSGWVDQELKVALDKEDQLGGERFVMPVFLDDIDLLVRGHERLRKRWLTGSGRLVDRFGSVADPGADTRSQARKIASDIAGAIYRRLKIEKADDVVIYFDQRGEGVHRDKPQLSEDLLGLNAPALVFRPDLGTRSKVDTLHGADWEEARDTVQTALAEALGDITRLRKIHVAGHAQLGLGYLIGNHFDRTTNTELFCTGRFGDVLTNAAQSRFGPLKGGNPNCETRHPEIGPVPRKLRTDTISLLLCKEDEKYIGDVLRHVSACRPSPPAIWVKHEDRLTSSEQVMAYVADVVALLGRLYKENGVRKVHLYTSLPFHALPLLGANLKDAVEEVVFMDYRRDLRGSNPKPRDPYSPLRF